MRLPRLSPATYRRLALATLVSLVAITVIGAGVRLTGSGLGCSTWPSCEPGSFTPHSASDTHAVIEFANRLANMAVGVLTILAVVGARLRRPYRPDLFRWALGVFAWVLGNGLVGAAVVLLELSPLSVIGHFVLALGALWNGLMLYDRAGSEPAAQDEPAPWAATPRFVAAARWLVGWTAVALASGTVVTGSGPHAGDERADRLALEVGTVARVHGVTVIVLLVMTVAVVRMAHRGDASPTVAHRADQLVVVLVAQGAIGYWQYFTGVPALLVAFHVLGAVLVWLAVLRLWLALRQPVQAATGTAALAPPAAARAGSTAGEAAATA